MAKIESGSASAAADGVEAARGEELLAQAKLILRTTSVGALATLDVRDGSPFSSLVAVATDVDGGLLLLTSALSAHSRHMDADPRVSVLLAVRGKGDPLAHPRLTVLGRAAKAEGETRARARARFLARHPKSALYADFADFSFWIVETKSAHFNGGFAKAAQFEAAALATRTDDAADLVAIEPSALAHLNEDHQAALNLYAQAFAGQTGGRWKAAAIDPEGLDLVSGDVTVRVVFPERVRDAAGLRSILAALAKTTRDQSGRTDP